MWGHHHYHYQSQHSAPESQLRRCGPLAQARGIH